MNWGQNHTSGQRIQRVKGYSRSAGLLQVAGELVEEAVGRLALHLAGQVHEVPCLQQVRRLWQALADLEVGLPVQVGCFHVTQRLWLAVEGGRKGWTVDYTLWFNDGLIMVLF